MSPWEIPVIFDLAGKPTSQVVFNNPVPAPTQICPAARSNSSTQSSEKVIEEKKTETKELSAAEKFEKFKAEGNEFVKKVIIP